MYIWSLIPARAGSVRVEHKNTHELADRPLIDYPILASIAWGQAHNTIISTNDPLIREHLRKYSGAHQGVIDSQRPEEYAQGDIPITVWITDLIRKSARKPDIIAYLQPTSPFVDPKKLRLALSVLGDTRYNSVQTVTRVPHNYHAFNQRFIDSGNPFEVRFRYPHDREKGFNAAAKPPHYKFGNFVMFRVAAMKEQGTVFTEPSFPMEIERGYDVDINDEFDFKLAEWYLQTGVVELEHLNGN